MLPNIKKILLFLSAILIISSSISLPANAVLDQKFFVGNDIWAYDDECKNSVAGAEYVQLAGDNNEEKILNFFMRKGLTLAQASGIIGNMYRESGLKSNIREGLVEVGDDYIPENTVGFGLVQWSFTPRQKPLMDYMKSMGVPITDLSGQLGFVWEELNGKWLSTLNKLRATDDPVEAAVIVHDGYEVSADSKSNVINLRGGKAQEVYDKYKDAPALAGATADETFNNPGGFMKNASFHKDKSSNNCKGSTFSGGDFEQTLKHYAWTEWKGMTTEATEDYKTAIKNAQSEGLYVGGTNHPGIDCGGFVTLLIRDSGYDKGYNFDGKGGSTTKQENWLRSNWESLGSSSSIDASSLQPGDVAINGAHTFIYVGEIEGFGAKIASSSLDERAPMADTQQSPNQPGFNWYRKK